MGKIKTPIGIKYPLIRGNHGYFDFNDEVKDELKTNLINLIRTKKGERPMQPEFGTDLPNMLFENIDSDYLIIVENAIRAAIEEWMPFVSIEEFTARLSTDSSEENRIYIKIILTFNSDTTQTTEIILSI